MFIDASLKIKKRRKHEGEGIEKKKEKVGIQEGQEERIKRVEK